MTSGLVDGSDPKAIGTIRAVESSLRDGPTVYRYRHDDGLPGTEGGMHICTSWLIEAYAAAGMLDEADNLYAQLLECAGATGLLPEMHNPELSTASATIRRRIRTWPDPMRWCSTGRARTFRTRACAIVWGRAAIPGDAHVNVQIHLGPKQQLNV